MGRLSQPSLKSAIYALSFAASSVFAQATCSSSLTPSYSAPVAAAGWQAQLVATGLTEPRGLAIDKGGHLLIVQQNVGIVRVELSDAGGACLSVARNTTLIAQTNLNHGITFSNDGSILYASSSNSVYSWSYGMSGPSLSNNRTIITGMANGGHTTRTLLMSTHRNNTIIVSRGSDGNLDAGTRDVSSGRSQIRAFDLSRLGANDTYDFNTQGILLGWGLRNSVVVAEEPSSGRIYSVENSADQIQRSGVDIHIDNPGEELNHHGSFTINGSIRGDNYGYPDCFAVWDPAADGLQSLSTGKQFVLNPSSTLNDSTCAMERSPPRLTFQAHTAPLDIIFDKNGSAAYVSFHGSWNRSPPAGYHVSVINFANGEPVAASDSRTSENVIFSNANIADCPRRCVRPVGLAMDAQGRVLMTSDSTGELWVLARTATGSPITTGGVIGTTTTLASSMAGTKSLQGQMSWILSGILVVCISNLL